MLHTVQSERITTNMDTPGRCDAYAISIARRWRPFQFNARLVVSRGIKVTHAARLNHERTKVYRNAMALALDGEVELWVLRIGSV